MGAKWRHFSKLARFLHEMKIALSIASLSLLIVLTGPNRAEEQGKTSVVITASGVGPLNAGTPFKISAIAKLFPGLKVAAGVDMTEGMEFPTIEVIDSRGVLLEIVPVPNQSVIYSVMTKRKEVLHRGRGQIGSSYPEIFGAKLSKACSPGSEEMSDKLICQAPESDSIHLVFGGLDSTSPSPAELKNMRIMEIYWTPK